MLRLSTLYGILPNELLERLSVSELNELLAFMIVWPDGADVMDRRFEALRLDINTMSDRVVYASGGMKQKPQQHKIEEFKLFNRGTSRQVRRFEDMEQDEVNQRMRHFAKRMSA